MKVILYMAESVNGIIARNDNSTHWSNPELEAYIEMVKECGNLIIGRRTYEIMQKDTDKDADAGNLGNPTIIVLSKKGGYKNSDKQIFVKSPEEALNVLKKKGFKKAMVAGGSETDSAFLKEKLINEIYLDIEPLIIGGGIPLFSPFDYECHLQLLNIKKIDNNTVQLHYKMK